MQPQRTGILTHIINAFWRALYPLNALLMLVGVLQVGLLIIFCVGKIDVPDFVLNKIRNSVQRFGIDVACSSMEISVPNGVSFKNVSVRFSGTPSPFFKADRVDADFWITNFLRGDVSPRTIRVINGNLSDTVNGVDKKKTIFGIYADIHHDGNWWKCDALTLNLERLKLNLRGALSEKFSVDNFLKENGLGQSNQSKEKKSIRNASYAEVLDDALYSLRENIRYLDVFSVPVCEVEFFLSGGNSSWIKLNFSADKFSTTVKDRKLTLDNLKLYARYGGKISEGIRVVLLGESFKSKDFPSVDNLAASVDIFFEKGECLAENFDASLMGFKYEGVNIDNISLRKDYLNASDYGKDWDIFISSSDCRLDVKINADKISAEVDFNGKVYPDVFLKHKMLEGIEELKQLAFNRGIFLSGKAHYAIKENQLRADARFSTDDCIIMNIPVLYAGGKIKYDSESGILDAFNLSVFTREGWNIEGRFEQNLKDYRYKIRVGGNVQPMAIAHFMEDWWTRVFKSFKFNDVLPSGDFFIEGTWGAPEFIWCYGMAQGANASYNGEAFDNFSVLVWVNPKRITVYDVDLNVQNRKATGFIEWLYGNEGITTYNQQRLVFETTLNSKELIALAGEDAKEVLDVVRVQTNPSFKINGLMRNPSNNPEKLRDIFNVDGYVNGDTLIEMAVLQNMKFTAQSDKVLTVVNDAEFEFCGGKAKGSIVLDKSSGKMLFDAKAKGEKINQLEFTKFLQSLDTSDSSNKSASATSDSFTEGAEKGSVDLDISLRGSIDEIELSQGKGVVLLENDNFMKLHLLGMLSRTFSALKLPLGSFDISYAKSPFEISDGKIVFTSLELGGPVMQIQGAATYNYLDDNLNSTLSIKPFGSMKGAIGTGISVLVSPLASTIEVKLNGKLSDPEISMSVKPMNIIKSDENIVDTIRENH